MSKYRIYKRGVLEGLHFMSNKELQKISWFNNDLGLSSSFLEDWEGIFELSYLDKAIYDKDVVVFSKKADAALRTLNEACDAVGYERDERELINAADMNIVRQKAAEALALVLMSDGSESTEEIVKD